MQTNKFVPNLFRVFSAGWFAAYRAVIERGIGTILKVAFLHSASPSIYIFASNKALRFRPTRLG